MFVGNLQSSVISRLKIHELGMFARWHTPYGHTAYASQNARLFTWAWDHGHKTVVCEEHCRAGMIPASDEASVPWMLACALRMPDPSFY